MIETVYLSEYLRKKCELVGKARDAQKRPESNAQINFKDESWYLHYTGLRSECAVACYLVGSERAEKMVDWRNFKTGDPGFDLLLGHVHMQVKAASGSVPELKFNMTGNQILKPNADVVVNCRFDRRAPAMIELWGYVHRIEFERNKFTKNFGHGPRWTVLNSLMGEMEELKEICLL